jgi:hypothetical protein
MCGEIVLADMVRTWVEAAFPGNERAARLALAVALDRYAAGASVSEAFEEARRLVGSWSRHPCHLPATRHYSLAAS